jgi:hypothetical protein
MLTIAQSKLHNKALPKRPNISPTKSPTHQKVTAGGREREGERERELSLKISFKHSLVNLVPCLILNTKTHTQQPNTGGRPPLSPPSLWKMWVPRLSRAFSLNLKKPNYKRWYITPLPSVLVCNFITTLLTSKKTTTTRSALYYTWTFLTTFFKGRKPQKAKKNIKK